MKNKCLAFLVLLSLLGTSCSSVSDSNSQESTIESIDKKESSSNSETEVSYEVDESGFCCFEVDEVEPNTYDGKTKLVYLTNYDTFAASIDQQRACDEIAIENAVNDYLDEKGYDFYVDFILNSEMDYLTQELNQNFDVYEQMIENGEQIDIVNTGYSNVNFGGYDDTFNLFVENGYLEPLNDYFESELGQAFYNEFDELFWAQTTTFDGKTYAKSSIYELAAPLVLAFDESSCESYNFDISSIESIEALEPYLDSFASDGYSGLYLSPDNDLYYEILNFYKYNGVFINAKTSKPENIFENEDAIEYFKLINDYVEKGYVTNTMDEYLPLICSVDIAMPLHNSISTIISEGYLQFEDINCAVGISSSSENKKSAFELLALLNTDEELANLIYNGVEGRNYVVVDGTICLNYKALPFYDVNETMTNPIITDSNCNDNPQKSEDFKLCNENSKISAYYKFEVSDDLQDKLDTIAEINNEFYGLFYGDYGDYGGYEDMLKAANEKLKDAGIDEVNEELSSLV
ncbi:MAG: ABC transporter substrate-binding protein [Ruminococcus sp.]|nr:ABC transporter substrate-binding protein [Ruminococcus sp.]